MATKSDFSSASGLHMVRHMIRVAVVILATLSLTACGVGADEAYDGQTLVASGGQALVGSPEGTPGPSTPTSPQAPVTTTPSPVRSPGTVALPQDPIPVFEGRTAMPPMPFGTSTPVPGLPPSGR